MLTRLAPLLLLVASVALAADVKLPVPELEQLPNGLTVAWFLNDSLPVIDLALLVRSGYVDDPAGKSGVSELVAATLDRGAAGLAAKQIAYETDKRGATRYASSDEDTFTVGMHGLAPDADALLELLGKLVTKPEFPEAEVARERARMIDRWKHMPDFSETLASVGYSRAIAQGTPYGRGAMLSAKEAAGLGRADVVAYHKTHFTPRNAILMVVGRAKKDEFRKRIDAAFGSWQGAAPTRAAKPATYGDPRAKLAPGEALVVERPGLTQAQIRIGFRTPPIDAPDHYAFSVANALLGEYFHSRLNSLVRDKLGLTYGISSGLTYSKHLSKLTVSSATRNETVGEVVRATLDVLRELKKSGAEGDEVTQAKEYLMGGFPLSVSTLGAIASRWLNGYVFGLGTGYLNEFLPKVGAVTAAQVTEAAKKDLDLDRLVIVVAGEGAPVEKSLRAAGLSKIKRVKAKDLM